MLWILGMPNRVSTPSSLSALMMLSAPDSMRANLLFKKAFHKFMIDDTAEISSDDESPGQRVL
jgi:hypothetical protein